MASFTVVQRFPLSSENFARTATASGQRTYFNDPDSPNGPLCDKNGRLLVRAVAEGGYSDVPPGSTAKYVFQLRGSGAGQTNEGPVSLIRLMARPGVLGAGGVAGTPYVTRLFGASEALGFVQIIMKDESAVDPNIPVVGDVPEITIPIGLNQNFVFSNYQLNGNTTDLATYLVLSTTFATYTPHGAVDPLWFTFYGMV